MIIPFAAGGPTDVLGRIVGAAHERMLGQQVVIENVGGAGGMTGSKRVADAQPDGYTIGIGTVGTHAQGQTLYKRPLYNSQTDFTPVALLAQVPIVLTARKDLPVKDFKEFVAYAQANQAKMQFGSAGAGSATHLGCVLLNYILKHQHHPHPVPRHRPGDDRAAGRPHRLPVRGVLDRQAAYRRRHRQGARDLQRDALAGAAEPGDRGRAGHQGPDRLHLERDLPAEEHAGADRRAAEQGAVDAINTPAVKEKLAGLGAEIATGDQTTPAYLGKLVKDETEKWAVPIKASGVSVDVTRGSREARSAPCRTRA